MLRSLPFLSICLAATTAHAANVHFVPWFLDGRPGITALIVESKMPRETSRSPLCGGDDETSAATAWSAAGVALASLAYLADRTHGMDGFRKDALWSLTSYAAVGAINGAACARNGWTLASIGVASSLVGSIAEYRRALDYREGVAPLIWSGVQGAALSAYENALAGRPALSRLGMDFGPGFVSFRWDDDARGALPSVRYQWRVSSTVGMGVYAARGYRLELRESLRTGGVVFRADSSPGVEGSTAYAGYAYGNTFATYRPPRPGNTPAQEHFDNLFYDWALPAHERAHASILQKMDVLLQPLNDWAEQGRFDSYVRRGTFEPMEGGIGRFFRPGGEIGAGIVAGLGMRLPHDARPQELTPESLEAEILRRGGYGGR